MPLRNSREITFVDIPEQPEDINTRYFQIRFTGEFFIDYKSYISRLNYYKQRKFSCKYSGKSKLTFEQALKHEICTKEYIENAVSKDLLIIILNSTQFCL